MEHREALPTRAPLKQGEFDPGRWRNTKAGMWSWLWQRFSAIAIVVLLALHLSLTYRPLIQFLLLLMVTFHAALGLRVILLDFSLVNVKYQKALIAVLMAAGIAALFLIWNQIY
ncbi:MAG: succinate dehydrogenase [Deltaproteobacteria bacterium RIFOXYB12_FULL_58_9]|nr:MAG: succinate dehydrogenase [Deltaproteobacteria bacterium RIFOXYB12_FULL_58_9]